MPPFFYSIGNQKKYSVNVNSVNVNKKCLTLACVGGMMKSSSNEGRKFMENEKKPVSMRLSALTQERLQRALELYKSEADGKRDQQEAALNRILEIVESADTQIKHPLLEESLKSAESTISTLIKQINGIAAGQDSQISELQEQLNEAIQVKNEALEKAKEAAEAAKAKQKEADAAIAQAVAEVEAAKEQAQEQIEASNAAAEAQIKVAEAEKRQALKECEDARTIAAEKEASNILLLKQMQGMEEEVAAYKQLQKEYQKLNEKVTNLKQEQIKKDAAASLELEKAIITKEREYMAQIANLEAEIKQLEKNCRK